MLNLSVQPLVSILTPVYNGEDFLSQCIESVLAQDYTNWEYHIVNNCSTDGTLRIAQKYAAIDPRIRITNNSTFVNVAENHNNAFRLVSKRSRYFKVVSADDWILPECLGKMVRFAVEHPSVGILCCYQESGDKVKWAELPASTTVLPGREASRMALLNGVSIFGAPTSLLYRTDLLHLGKPFFPNLSPHADTSACFEFLDCCDFGVLPEILAVERVHTGQISSKIERLGAGSLAYLEMLLKYGPKYLSLSELTLRRKEVFKIYYRYLGGCALKLNGMDFWNFQKARLHEMGCKFSIARIAWGALHEVLTETRAPGTAIQKVVAAIKSKL